MSTRAHRAERSARGAREIRPVRRRGIVAASGFAVLVLALGGCGEEGTAEEAVGEATSAVG
ncbi:DUF732 domain-containing protein, partial [Dietzia sp. DQ11-38-2]|nr:DUF732 domain-containing protein [Dietzia sp. DQ11-38-2]